MIKKGLLLFFCSISGISIVPEFCFAQSNGVNLSWGTRTELQPSARSDESLRQEGMIRAALYEAQVDEFWKWALLAQEAMIQGSCDKCVFFWEQANKTIPEFRSGQFHRIGGQCYMSCGDYRQAKKCFRFAIGLGDYESKLELEKLKKR